MSCASLDVTNKVSLVQLAMGSGLAAMVDEDQIKQVLSVQLIVTYAAAILVDSLCASFALEVDFSSGATSYKASQKVEAYKALADLLRAFPGDFIGGDGSGVGNVGIFVGGVSKSGERSLRADSDLIQPSFAIGQFDDHTSGVSEED